MPAHLRRATPADAPALAVLSHVASAQTETWVATERGIVIGFATLGSSCAPDAPPWTGEVSAIALLPVARRRGFGRALWAMAADRLAATGHRHVRIRAPVGDARAFALRLGLREEGALFTGPLSPLPFAAGLAAALDAGDRASALRFLAPDCRLTGPGAEQVGAEATLTGLLETSGTLFEALEEARVEREVEALGGDRFRARVSARLRHGGHSHTWRAQETLTIPPDQGVVRVVLHDPERPKLAVFLRRAGILG